MKELNLNPFTKFDKQWALLTAGDKEKFNSMTISWGSMGTLWHKPIVTIYVKPTRYTYEFLKENEYFTISFFGSEYQKTLAMMGSVSGRNVDKIKESRLTPKFLENGITFEQAKETFVCKKIYMDQMNKEKFPKDALKLYERRNEGEAHYLIIGELQNIE